MISFRCNHFSLAPLFADDLLFSRLLVVVLLFCLPVVRQWQLLSLTDECRMWNACSALIAAHVLCRAEPEPEAGHHAASHEQGAPAPATAPAPAGTLSTASFASTAIPRLADGDHICITFTRCISRLESTCTRTIHKPAAALTSAGTRGRRRARARRADSGPGRSAELDARLLRRQRHLLAFVRAADRRHPVASLALPVARRRRLISRLRIR